MSELKLEYERMHSPPKVDPLPDSASTENRNERLKMYYEEQLIKYKHETIL
jgi:hypothetical protein